MLQYLNEVLQVAEKCYGDWLTEFPNQECLLSELTELKETDATSRTASGNSTFGNCWKVGTWSTAWLQKLLTVVLTEDWKVTCKVNGN